jgi:hypothetical protein
MYLQPSIIIIIIKKALFRDVGQLSGKELAYHVQTPQVQSPVLAKQ